MISKKPKKQNRVARKELKYFSEVNMVVAVTGLLFACNTEETLLKYV